MKKINILCLLLIAACFFSCKGDPQKKEKAGDMEIAKALCTCMEPLMALNKKVTQLSEAGDTDALQALIGEAERITREGQACADRLEAQYGEIEGEQEEKIMGAMKNICPEVVAVMESTEE